MSTDLHHAPKHRVQPQIVPELTKEDIAAARRNWSLGGCFGWSIGVFIGLVGVAAVVTLALEVPERQQEELVGPIYLASGLLAVVLPPLLYEVRARRRQTMEVARIRSQRERFAEEQAENLEMKAEALVVGAFELLGSLPQSIEAAEEALDRAEREFDEKAYGPFWDEVERAAGALAQYRHAVQALSEGSVRYHRLLEGQRHDFPVFPVRTTGLPDPARAVQIFRRLVRLGQKDFEFATIWEHRRTRAVLIAGFRTLGEAIGQLDAAVSDSIAQLGHAMGAQGNLLIREVRDFEASYEAWSRKEVGLLRAIVSRRV